MSRWASGDVDVLFAAEEAEVGRPFEDERLGGAADAEADADRTERRAIGELVAAPPGGTPGGNHHAPPGTPSTPRPKTLPTGALLPGRILAFHPPRLHPAAPGFYT